MTIRTSTARTVTTTTCVYMGHCGRWRPCDLSSDSFLIVPELMRAQVVEAKIPQAMLVAEGEDSRKDSR